MTKRTPGPWELFNKNGIISIYKKNKEVIKWTGFDSSDYPESATANAKFILLADHHFDALVEALEAACARCRDCGGSGTAYTMEDETEIGCAPGSSAIECPGCSEWRELLAKIKTETEAPQ